MTVAVSGIEAACIPGTGQEAEFVGVAEREAASVAVPGKERIYVAAVAVVKREAYCLGKMLLDIKLPCIRYSPKGGGITTYFLCCTFAMF